MPRLDGLNLLLSPEVALLGHVVLEIVLELGGGPVAFLAHFVATLFPAGWAVGIFVATAVHGVSHEIVREAALLGLDHKIALRLAAYAPRASQSP